MNIRINWKKAFPYGLLVVIIQLVVNNLLWMNPVIDKFNEQYIGHPAIKPLEAFGGLDNWVLLSFLFGSVLISIWIVLYLIFYKSIPGKGAIKGLVFGLILWLIKSIPEALDQWLIFVYPVNRIIIQLLHGVISLSIFGVVLATVFNTFKVIEIEDSQEQTEE